MSKVPGGYRRGDRGGVERYSGHLAHKKTPTLYKYRRALGLVLLQGSRGGAVSDERGSPVDPPLLSLARRELLAVKKILAPPHSSWLPFLAPNVDGSAPNHWGSASSRPTDEIKPCETELEIPNARSFSC